MNRLYFAFSSFGHVALLLLLLTGGFPHSTSAAEWVLIWSDEFEGPAGQLPDATKWDYDIGTDWGNLQLEYDTDRASNVSLDGHGLLTITAREEFYEGQPYTSARIVTRNRYEPTYGRIETRIKLPTGQGLWPAFWLLGSDIGSVGWPQCGEIDIMEYRGQEPTIVYGTLHGPGYSGGSGFGSVYVLPSGRFDSSFHTFAVEWDAGKISWYVDDVLYHQATPADLAPSEWVFDHPFYIILNVAVGGTFVGPPDASTVFPQTMSVDYVRVYRNSEGGDSCCVLRGDVNGDGSITASDIIYLVNHVFKGGVAPICLDDGDANDDGGMTSSDIIYLVNYVFKGGADPAECPVPVPYVFRDTFGPEVFFQSFAGSYLEALEVDAANFYAGTQGLAITIPDAQWSGGAFTTTTGLDLSPFNALTFWARASMGATLDVVGIGNDNTGNSKYVAEIVGLPLTTTWQKYVIPFPLAGKLTAEQGLFYFAEGAEAGVGYQIWMDEIVVENLSTITNPRPALASQTLTVDSGEVFGVGNGTVTFDVDGSDVVVSAMPAYFTFTSSNPSVVSVGADAVFTAAGAGSATLTAQLGAVTATGSVTVNVNPQEPVPLIPAPTPTPDPVDVLSLFSGAYTSATMVDTWSAGWDNADVDDYLIGSDSTKKYTNLVFAGIEFAVAPLDASAMTHFHMDVWTPDPTNAPAVFKVKLVDFGANGVYGGLDDVEHELTFDESTMNTGSWVSVEVPLADFTGLTTRAHLAQLLISGDPNTVFVDNIYFHK